MSDQMSRDQKSTPALGWWTQERIIAGYLAVFVSFALIGQAVSSIPAWEEGSPIEFFTSGLLWMLSLVSLLSAFQALPRARQSFFWFALSAALAVLAIDEALGVHERSEPYGVNDDFVKIAMWIVVPFVLARVVRLGGNRMVRNAFITGYVLHTLYLLVEVGDGEFFQLPVSTDRLKVAEEIFELLFLACYMFGFAVRYLAVVREDRARMDGIQIAGE